MIRGECQFNGEWPTMFSAVPRVGDFVEGTIEEVKAVKRVTQITHTLVESFDNAMNRTYMVPLILVEFEK